MVRRSRLLGLLACTMAAGCHSVPSDAHPPVASIRITPALDTIAFRGSASLVATPLDAEGNPTVPAGKAVWTSYSPTVVTVDTGGIVRSIWYGQGAIHVEIDGAHADAAIVVTNPPIDTVEIGSNHLTDVERGDTIQFYATAYDAVPQPVQGGLTWTVSDSTVLRVDSTGRVIALKDGAAAVSAALGGRKATVALVVLEPAASLTVVPNAFTILYDRLTSIRIVARDSAGHALLDRPITLTEIPGGTAVAYPASLAVGDSTATLRGVTPGSALIVASSSRRTDTLRVTVAPMTLRAVAAGDFMTCGLSVDSATYCWGEGVALGTGTDSGGPRPRLVAGGQRFVSLSGSNEAMCGLTAQGAAYCWGRGSVFTSPGVSGATPVPVADTLQFSELRVFNETVCGTSSGGAAVCWGQGWGTTPTLIPGGFSFSHIYLGGGGECASRSSDGVIYCWDPTHPTPAPLDSAVALSSFADGDVGRSCGLASGAVYCWAAFQRWFAPGTYTAVAASGVSVCVLDAAGAVGCAASDSALVPQNVPAALVSMTAGYYHLCGMGTDGRAYCWGGTIGYGELGFTTSPGTIVTPHAVMNQ